MIALQILEVKSFMSKLLLQGTFDHFLVSEGTIKTFATFHIDGLLQKDYFSSEELEEEGLSENQLVYWQQLKPFCLELIKGKKTPLSFKFVFQLAPYNVEKLLLQSGLSYSPSDVRALFLNFKYDGSSLTCITGTSMNLFTLDKSLDFVWDEMTEKFFRQNQIPFSHAE